MSKAPLVIALTALLQLGGSAAASAASTASTCAVKVTHDPVVIRMSKDEFRIAFGVQGDHCPASGCSGFIEYKAAWRTEDGSRATDTKRLAYNVPSGAERSIAVDRHYFDTAEAKHTTDIVNVTVNKVSCSDALAAR